MPIHDPLSSRSSDDPPGPPIPTEAWASIQEAGRLSQRELDVLRCIVDGHGEAGAASRMNVKPSTVHTYVARIYQKLGLSSHVEIVVWAFTQYLAIIESASPPRAISPEEETRGKG